MGLPVESGPAAARGVSPRVVNVVIGVWLFISAFVWPHTHAQMTNTWICGVVTVVFALVAMAVPWVRYLNTLLAIWLFISSWALPSAHPGTVWNNVLCAIAIFIVSLVPSAPGSTTPGMITGHPAPPRAA
jgi:hypothetical protein